MIEPDLGLRTRVGAPKAAFRHEGFFRGEIHALGPRQKGELPDLTEHGVPWVLMGSLSLRA